MPKYSVTPDVPDTKIVGRAQLVFLDGGGSWLGAVVYPICLLHTSANAGVAILEEFQAFFDGPFSSSAAFHGHIWMFD